MAVCSAACTDADRTLVSANGDSVKDIGSTPTAILGALEPITAVAIGCFCFGESFTTRLAVGIALILTAVLLIIGGKQMSPQRITVAFTRLGRMIVKTWRWKS